MGYSRVPRKQKIFLFFSTNDRYLLDLANNLRQFSAKITNNSVSSSFSRLRFAICGAIILAAALALPKPRFPRLNPEFQGSGIAEVVERRVEMVESEVHFSRPKILELGNKKVSSVKRPGCVQPAIQEPPVLIEQLPGMETAPVNSVAKPAIEYLPISKTPVLKTCTKFSTIGKEIRDNYVALAKAHQKLIFAHEQVAINDGSGEALARLLEPFKLHLWRETVPSIFPRRVTYENRFHAQTYSFPRAGECKPFQPQNSENTSTVLAEADRVREIGQMNVWLQNKANRHFLFDIPSESAQKLHTMCANLA